jgi:hypothetical protein
VARRLAHSDDSGATLIFALIFITAVAVMIAAVLSFVDTSMRTTVAVRRQAATAAAADGAAQVAINYVRTHGYITGGGAACLDGMSLPGSFYQQGGTSYSASVTCEPDASDSVLGGAGSVPITKDNRPGQAILTLGKGSDGGLEVYPRGSLTMKVKGDIYSNSYITSQKNLTGSADIKAVGPCAADAGGVMQSATGTLTTTPPGPQCNLGGSGWDDPKYAAPNDHLQVQSVPKCTGPKGPKLFQFSPGIYTDLVGLNDLTSSDNSNKCKGSILWFPPDPNGGGSYYFNLSGTWLIDSGTVLGGKPSHTPLDPANPPDMPKSCLTPVAPDDDTAGSWTPPPANAGVEFVLGGTSRISLGAANMEICGTYSKSKPPIALYGLKAAVGSAPGPVVPAQPDKLCADETSGLPPDNNGSICATLYSTTSAPSSHLYIQGTTYMPKAWVNVNINNQSGQVFRFGIISRKLTLFATASARLDDPVIAVPDLVNAGPSLTVLYLQVFVCTAPCTPGGGGAPPQLKVKVGITDADGTAHPAERQVTVYDWSVQKN